MKMDFLEQLRKIGVTNIDLANDTLTIQLGRAATNQDVDYIKATLFMGIKITNIDSLISVSENVIKVFSKNYDQFRGIADVLNGFKGIVIIGATIEPFAIIFEYVTEHRCTLDYNELEQVQAVIDPTIEMHDSVRVTGFNDSEKNVKSYTLRATVKT